MKWVVIILVAQTIAIGYLFNEQIKTDSALKDIGQVLGQSGLIEKDNGGNIFINKVIRLSDIQDYARTQSSP